MTIYLLSSFFVASYDPQGYGGGKQLMYSKLQMIGLNLFKSWALYQHEDTDLILLPGTYKRQAGPVVTGFVSFSTVES
jgi:hypothetical protein